MNIGNRVVRESIMNEEVIGMMVIDDIQNRSKRIIDVIKNPKNFRGISYGVRGISYRGDMYLADDNGDWVNLTHTDIIMWMIDKGILEGDFRIYNAYYISEAGGILCWQRLEDSSDMYLSESYYLDYIESDEFKEYMIESLGDLEDNIGSIRLVFEKI